MYLFAKNVAQFFRAAAITTQPETIKPLTIVDFRGIKWRHPRKMKTSANRLNESFERIKKLFIKQI